MSDAPLFVTTRAPAAQKRLIRNIVVTGLFFAAQTYVVVTTGLSMLTLAAFAVIALLFGFQLLTYLNTRQPLVLFQDRVEIAGLSKLTVFKKTLRGLRRLPDGGDPVLVYYDADKDFECTVRLPWRMIEQDRDSVLAAISSHYAFKLDRSAQ